MVEGLVFFYIYMTEILLTKSSRNETEVMNFVETAFEHFK